MGEFGEAMNQAEKPRLVPGLGEVDPVGGVDMTNKEGVKPIALACGITLAGSFAAVSVAQADSGTSPFAMTTLSAGYLLGAQEGTCGEGKCGEGQGRAKTDPIKINDLRSCRVSVGCMEVLLLRKRRGGPDPTIWSGRGTQA